MKRKGYIWMVAGVVVLLMGVAATQSDWVCNAAAELGFASSSCSLEGDEATTTAATVSSEKEACVHSASTACDKSGAAVASSSSECTYKKSRTAGATANASECPYKQKAAMASQDCPQKASSTELADAKE